MIADRWLCNDHDFPPGAELFRSERAFHVVAYTISHGQLLLSSPAPAEDGTTVQLLFKPVEELRLRSYFDGLVVSVAARQEEAPGRRLLTLAGQGFEGYVVCMAFGWRQGVLGRLQPSLFSPVSEMDVRWPTRPIAGADGGLGRASPADVVEAVTGGLAGDGRRERWHPAYVLVDDDGRTVGVFVTEADAREAARLLEPRACRVERAPLVF
ncbi:hypothetical protein Ais01nite_54270 [Asanoa ishikariensis]|uniref:Uncharacterized protein n=1 Tax=Asanoa ishikariensis TaxID=137265 RepID=A0A1H3TS95_9ACTN|nr:hypothetical protein [Asanoa ishikariensis]GIF67392.1 hypothetical protein Ais01nite_54270 [Asanoa ishikariensis]SDZ53020.1 hypothetical protein SAMN05421684_6288 [Asanoa ishikariensis]